MSRCIYHYVDIHYDFSVRTILMFGFYTHLTRFCKALIQKGKVYADSSYRTVHYHDHNRIQLSSLLDSIMVVYGSSQAESRLGENISSGLNGSCLVLCIIMSVFDVLSAISSVIRKSLAQICMHNSSKIEQTHIPKNPGIHHFLCILPLSVKHL